MAKSTLSPSTLAALKFTDGDGSNDVAMTFEGSQTALNAALATLAFAPAADYNGAASLSFAVTDRVTHVPKTVTLNISPVPDVVDNSLVMLKGQSAVFNVFWGPGGAAPDGFESPPVLRA